MYFLARAYYIYGVPDAEKGHFAALGVIIPVVL